MPIPNYIVFGLIKDSDSNAVNGATVYAIDRTTGDINVTTLTNASGGYQIDLSTLASVADGDSIVIACTYSHESMHSPFTLDISSPFKKIDMNLSWEDYKNDYNTDTLLVRYDIENKFDIDTILKSTELDKYDLDAFLRKTEYSKYSLDVLAQMFDINSEFLINLLLKLIEDRSLNLDILAQKLDIEEEYNLDVSTLMKDIEINKKIDILVDILLKNNYDLDALLQDTYGNDMDIDTLLLKNLGTSPLNDILLEKYDIEVKFVLKTLLNILNFSQFNIDTLIKRLDVEKYFLIDTSLELHDIEVNKKIDILVNILLKNNYDLDIMLRKSVDSNFNLDLLLLKTVGTTHINDILLHKFNVDTSYILRTFLTILNYNEYNIDTLIKNMEVEEQYIKDILLELHDIKTKYNIDTLVNILLKNEYDLDTLLRKSVDSKFDLDSLLLKTVGTTSINDILLEKNDIEIKYKLVAFLNILNRSGFNIDSLIKKMDVEEKYLLDISLELRDIEIRKNLDTLLSFLLKNNYDIDILLRKSVKTNFDLDSLLLKTVGTTSLNDTLLEKHDIEHSFIIDVLLDMINTNVLDLDLLISNMNIKNKFLIDVSLEKHDIETSKKLDILLKYVSLIKFGFDSLLHMFDVDTNYIIDTLLHRFKNESKYKLDSYIVERYLTDDYIINALLKKACKEKFNIDVPLLLRDIEIEAGLDVRVGRNLVVWTIDTCDEWNLGIFINNTICDDGDLILENY